MTNTQEPIKVGDKLYFTDDFRSPHLASWRSETIIGETKLSWLLPPNWKPAKVNKKDMTTARDYRGYRIRHYTKSEMDEKIFCSLHRKTITAAVESCESADVLRKVAGLLGRELDSQ